jgi:hypothetical protein
LWVKVSRGIVPFHHRESNPCLTPQWLYLFISNIFCSPFKDQLRSYFSKYNFLVATKQFNMFQIDHAITAKAEFLYKSGRQGYLATEQANKEKISIGPRYASVRCAHPSLEGQYITKTGRYAPPALHSFDASLTE